MRLPRLPTCISQNIHSVLDGIISFNIVRSPSSPVASDQTKLEEHFYDFVKTDPAGHPWAWERMEDFLLEAISCYFI